MYPGAIHDINCMNVSITECIAPGLQRILFPRMVNANEPRTKKTCPILRKTIEGYQNSFDFITFEKIISKKGCFVSELPMCNSAKCKMKFTGQWLRYSTTPNVTTLFNESAQAINFALIFFVASLTCSLLIF